jgi:RNA ligase
MNKDNVVYLQDILSREALCADIDNSMVSLKEHPNGELYLLNYTDRAQYSRYWTKETMSCRGLIVKGSPRDESCVVVSRPFSKFANVPEYGPDSPFGELPLGTDFEVSEKVDGSLCVLYATGETYALATRGSFVSTQALAATKLWQRTYSNVIVQ